MKKITKKGKKRSLTKDGLLNEQGLSGDEQSLTSPSGTRSSSVSEGDVVEVVVVGCK